MALHDLVHLAHPKPRHMILAAPEAEQPRKIEKLEDMEEDDEEENEEHGD